MKNILLLTLAVSVATLLPSCAVMDSIFGPPRINNKPLPSPNQQTVTDPNQNQNPALDAMGNRLGTDPNGNPVDPNAGNTGNPNNNQGRGAQAGNKPNTPQPPAPKPPKKKNYPFATPVANRPGFVTSPYTGAEIDVRGIASGSLVYDPEDPNEDHKFYVP